MTLVKDNVQLAKKLGLGGLLLFGMLCMFPMSPTQTYAAVAIASGGNAIPVYLIAAIAIIFTGFCYQFLSGEFSSAGGAYTYVQLSIHPIVGFIAGAIILLDYVFIVALLPTFAATWANLIFPDVAPWIIITLLMLFVTAVVGMGITVSKWVNYVFLGGQLAAIIALGIYTIIFVFVNKEGLAGFELRALINTETISWKALSNGAAIAILGFIGADSVATLSEEVKGGRRTVGLAIIMSIVLICMLQMIQALMMNLAHPDYTTLNPDSGYFDVMREVGGDTFYRIIVLGCVLFVGVANAIPPLTALGRVLYVMGRDNTLPASRFFATLNPTTRSPLNAILFSSGVAYLITWFVSLDTQSKMVNFGAMTTYVMVAFSVFWLFKIVKKYKGLAAAIKYVLVPILAISVIVFIMTGFDMITYRVGLTWIGIVLVYAAIFHKKFRINAANAEG